MVPLLKKLFTAILNDEVMMRRWLRAWLMAFATGGMGFADQLSAVTGGKVSVTAVRVLATISGFIAVAINLGEKNAPKEEPSKPGA